ncbi:MAG: hypothetical protein ACTH31_09965 [Pseudoclavibacter sp.]
MSGRLVGASVERDLDAALTGLLAGRLDLAALTPGLSGFYFAGWNAGRESVAQRLERAEDEAARWFEIAHNPDARAYRSMVLRRLDAAAENTPAGETTAEDFTAWLQAAITPRQAA